MQPSELPREFGWIRTVFGVASERIWNGIGKALMAAGIHAFSWARTLAHMEKLAGRRGLFLRVGDAQVPKCLARCLTALWRAVDQSLLE